MVPTHRLTLDLTIGRGPFMPALFTPHGVVTFSRICAPIDLPPRPPAARPARKAGRVRGQYTGKESTSRTCLPFPC